MGQELELYHYWRSSASWRVRWALQLKKIPCGFVAVDLLRGEQKNPEHLARNPLGTVPVLAVTQNGKTRFLAESLAIIEWLDENYPHAPLLPTDPFERARVRQLAEIVNAGIHPVQNPKVAKFYAGDDETRCKSWIRHWIREGLKGYETLVKETAGRFSAGDRLTLADVCLIPQCYNARRYEMALETEFPAIARIEKNAIATPECQSSAPDKFQPK